MATNLPSCLFIQFLEELLKFLVNFTLLKYVKSQRSYGFLVPKELIFGFQVSDLKDHFSASLKCCYFRSILFSIAHNDTMESWNVLSCSIIAYYQMKTTPLTEMLSCLKVAKKYMHVYYFHVHFMCWNLLGMLETDNFG